MEWGPATSPAPPRLWPQPLLQACGGCRGCRPDNPLQGQIFLALSVSDGQPPSLDRPPETRVELARLIDYLAAPEAMSAWFGRLMEHKEPAEGRTTAMKLCAEFKAEFWSQLHISTTYCFKCDF